MRKWLLAAAALLGLTSSALAVCPSPLTGKDAGNTTQNFGVTVDGSGNCYGNVALVDGTAAANKAAVNASGQLAIAGPVTNAGTFAVQLSGATNNINNISGTVSLPTGAATSALQTTGNTALTTINTTLGSPFQAGGSIGNTTFAATQTTSSNLKAQVDPLTAASWGIGTATQNSTSATNGQLALAQFNTSPTTITTGNMSPLQLDNAGNLLVNIKAGAGSGGTAIADGATFTIGTTNETPAGCYASSGITPTTGKASVLSCDLNGNLRVVGTGVAIGSTTSGQTGSMVMGAVTTSSPTYTTAQTSPLSMDTSGGLRVNCITGCGGSGGTAGADAGTFTAGTTQLTPVGGQFTSGGATACVTGHFCMSGITAARALFTDETSYGGLTVQPNPCITGTITYVPVSQTANAQYVSLGGSSKKNYICAVALVGADAENISVVEGTGTVCATTTAAIIGATTAANGMNFAANGGLTLGNGAAPVGAGSLTSLNNVCVYQSGSGRVSGIMVVAQQ